jgi:glycosyltransferase involved in cell wall biosynthesis
MISLLVPTRNRPHRLMEMIRSVMATAKKLPEVLCYVSDDDHSYDYLTALNFIRGPRLVMSDLWNALVPHATGDIFMLCADDVVFRTPGWDVEIEKAFAEVPDKILLAFADDGSPNGKRFASLPFVSRKWVETVGYFTGPGFSADYSDTWPFDVATMIGRVKHVPVLIEHMHHVWGKAQVDQTYQENKERMARDNPAKLYADLLPERMRDAEKLRAVMHGD